MKDILQQHGASESYIAENPLSPVDFKQDSNVPEKIIDVDTLVASLIATITFAAIFTVPGGIDDKDSKTESQTKGIAPSPSGDGSGVARMALEILFQVFLFSDSLAMFGSLTVVIAWLFRERLQTKLMSDRSLLPKLSALSLGISIVSTGLAFLSATILVNVPRDSENRSNSAEYESLLWGEIFTAFSAPALSLLLLTILWTIEYNFNATLEIRARLRKQVKEGLIYIIPPLALVLGIIIAFGYQYFSV